MKKIIWISISVIILLVAGWLVCFPKHYWIMMLHRNVFQTEYYLNNEQCEHAPFQVMLSDIVPDSTNLQDATKYQFKIYIQDGDSIEEYNLLPGKTYSVNQYDLGLYQFSYNPQTQHYVCLVQFSKRCFRWKKSEI